VEFGVLGPVTARHDGRDLPLGGPKQRALLAIMLLRANKPVSRERLIDGLWGERPPPSAAHTLDGYVSRLRKALGVDRITRRAPGYAVRVEPGELDLDLFERRFRDGREALGRGDLAEAVELLAAALGLWRGPALVDVQFEPFAQAEAERLEERRLLAVEGRIEAQLAVGRAADLIAELERLVGDHPFRERLVGHLMLALYRAGRQTEALAAFQSARRRLAEELGLEPGPALRDLERKILIHDSSLEPPPPRAELSAGQRPPRGRRRLVIAGVAATAAVAASVLTGILLAAGGPTALADRVEANQLVGLSVNSGARIHDVPLRDAPAAIAGSSDSLWLADPNEGTVSRVDLNARAVVDRIPLGGDPGGVAIGGESVWVLGARSVTRIDPATGAVTQTIGLGGASAAALAFGEGGLWVADTTDDTLIQLDPATGAVRRTVAVDLRPTALAIGAGAIWAADYDAHSVAEVDPRSGRTVARVNVGKGPVALAVGSRSIWVVSALDSTVSRIDPIRGSVVATIAVGSGPTALAVADDSVWVANQYSGTVSEIDPERNAVVRTTSVGGTPTTITAADGALWVGVQPRAQHRGGTLVLLHRTPLSIDPAVQLGVSPFQSVDLTGDGLVTFNGTGGPAGLQLVPDLAISLPTPTDGGRTYTFRLRPGIRYSDGRLVRAADFRRAIERVFRMRALDRDLLTGIIGAAVCSAPNATRCDLRRGIVTNDDARWVTFHLVAPDPNFLSNLTNGGLSMPVPTGTPMRDTGFTPIPGTGPYKVASADRQHIRYVRNPYFREWSHAAQPDGNPDEILWRFGLLPAQEVRVIQEGRADWMADPVPGALLPTLETRFASQLHSFPSTDTEWLQFNTNLPPFDDIRVRKALNLAIDRRVFVGIYGGPQAADPTCQLLPPGVPGYHRYCPYTRNPSSSGKWTGPDLARARRLVSASGTRSARITVWGWTDDPYSPPRVVHYTASVLRSLGYRVRVRLVTHASLAHPPPRVFGTIPLIPTGWSAITAYDFLGTWLSCAGAGNHGWYCVPRLDREMRRARSLESTSPRDAARLWAKIERKLVDRGALVPLVNLRQTDFVSARIRNYQHHTYLGFIAGQVWLR
jgi:YVTN family beta-propeller protein